VQEEGARSPLERKETTTGGGRDGPHMLKVGPRGGCMLVFQHHRGRGIERDREDERQGEGRRVR
jgi:hypothetical protein